MDESSRQELAPIEACQRFCSKTIGASPPETPPSIRPRPQIGGCSAAGTIRPAATCTGLETLVNENNSSRHDSLGQLFSLFDLDGSGAVEPQELLELGRVNNRSSQWSQWQNERLLEQMDKDGSGRLSQAEFCSYLDQALPEQPDQFELIMKGFSEAAHRWRREKAQRSPQQAAERKAAERKAAERKAKLSALYDLFDLDGSGTVDAHEIGWLSKASNPRAGWTASQSKAVIERLADCPTICREALVSCLDQALPDEPKQFSQVLNSLMHTAEAAIDAHCREKDSAALKTKAAEAEKSAEVRKRKLGDVFDLVDWDNSGTVDTSCFHQMGTPQSAAPWAPGEWTGKQHDQFVHSMDRDQDGRVSKTEFVDIFEGLLPPDELAFDLVLEQIREVGQQLRDRQLPREVATLGPTRDKPVGSAKAWQSKSDRAFALMDEGSGLIDTEDLLQLNAQLVNHMPTNSDTITKDQYEAAIQKGFRTEEEIDCFLDALVVVAEQSGRLFKGGFARDDQDDQRVGGSTISSAERQQSAASLFQLIDADGYGLIVVQELLQRVQHIDDTALEGLIEAMDRNGDGTISKSEFKAFFDKELPLDRQGFYEIIHKFTDIAKESTVRKVQDAVTKDAEQREAQLLAALVGEKAARDMVKASAIDKKIQLSGKKLTPKLSPSNRSSSSSRIP